MTGDFVVDSTGVTKYGLKRGSKKEKKTEMSKLLRQTKDLFKIIVIQSSFRNLNTLTNFVAMFYFVLMVSSILLQILHSVGKQKVE